MLRFDSSQGHDGAGATYAFNAASMRVQFSHPSFQQGGKTGDPPVARVTTTTPSGVKLFYQDEPKRLYTVNGKWVPSVTTILGVLDKPALPWWGMKIGVEGVLKLLSDGVLRFEDLDDLPDTETAVEALTASKLTVNHVKDKAGSRGTSVHRALEDWADFGKWPDPFAYPAEEQGYVRGVMAFLEDAAPEVIASELMVGSVVHEFAGRYDLLAILGEREVVTRLYPKRKPKRETIDGGVYLLDLKTSKNVYTTHHLQLAAYEGATRECGYTPSDFRGVVRVSPTGGYELVRSDRGYFDAFLAVNECWRAMESLKK